MSRGEAPLEACTIVLLCPDSEIVSVPCTYISGDPATDDTVNLQPGYSVKRHDVIILSICKIFAFDVSSVSDEWFSAGGLP